MPATKAEQIERATSNYLDVLERLEQARARVTKAEAAVKLLEDEHDRRAQAVFAATGGGTAEGIARAILSMADPQKFIKAIERMMDILEDNPTPNDLATAMEIGGEALESTIYKAERHTVDVSSVPAGQDPVIDVLNGVEL